MLAEKDFNRKDAIDRRVVQMILRKALAKEKNGSTRRCRAARKFAVDATALATQLIDSASRARRRRIPHNWQLYASQPTRIRPMWPFRVQAFFSKGIRPDGQKIA